MDSLNRQNRSKHQPKFSLSQDNSEYITIGQLNMQNSVNVRTEDRKLIQDYKLNILMGQDPFSIHGRIKGFSLSSSNIVLGHQRNTPDRLQSSYSNTRWNP